jgi:hypothetical protein
MGPHVQSATWAQQVLDWRLLPSCPQLQLIDARFGGEPAPRLQLKCLATAAAVLGNHMHARTSHTLVCCKVYPPRDDCPVLRQLCCSANAALSSSSLLAAAMCVACCIHGIRHPLRHTIFSLPSHPVTCLSLLLLWAHYSCSLCHLVTLSLIPPGELTKADVLGVEVDDPDSEDDEADPDPAQPGGRAGSVARSAKSGRSHR